MRDSTRKRGKKVNMREDNEQRLEEIEMRRSRKRKERARQVRIYKSVIAAIAVLIAAGICYTVLGQRNRREPDREEIEIEQTAEREEEDVDEFRPATPSSAEEQETISQTENLDEESTDTESIASTEWPEELRQYNNPGMPDVSDYLNIRETADESAPIIGRLPANGICEILEEGEVWYHIQSGEVEGYVNGSYVLTDEAARDRVNQVMETQGTLEVAVSVGE